jgi:hypothetical protein
MRRFATILWFLLAGSAFGAVHSIPPDEPVASLDIPDKWKTIIRGEGVEATSPDGGLHFLALPPERNKVAEGVGEMMRYIRNTGGIIVKPETVKGEPGQINGIDVQRRMWHGKDKKGEVNIRFTIFLPSKENSVIAASWGSPAAEKNNDADLKKILQSLKRP